MGKIISQIKKYRYYISLVVIILLLILIINPRGNFPLNDDWRYASVVKGIAEDGIIQVKQTFAPNLLFQLGYGVIIVKLFGFSFDILRISTLILFFLFSLFFLKHASSRCSNNRFAFFLTLLVITNPLLLGLSFSYMTDVPFAVLVFGSVIFYRLHYSRRKNIYLITGIFFSFLSFLIRQPGLIFPILYMLLLSFENNYSKRSLFQLIAVSILVVLFYFLIEEFKMWTGLAKMYIPVENQFIESFLSTPLSSFSEVVKKVIKLFITLGIFLIPLLPFYSFRNIKLLQHVVFWSLNLIILLVLIHVGKVFPFGGNYINLYGFGPALLKDVCVLQIENLPQVSTAFTYFLNYAGQLSFTYQLYFHISNEIKNKNEVHFHYFLLGSIFIYMSFISITSFFDRYMLVPFVLIVMYFLEEKDVFSFSKTRTLFAIILLLPIFYFTVAGVHDYMTWHREKYALFEELKQEGIGIDEMDAGHEINAWHLAGKISESAEGKSWWYVMDDKYLFSFGSVPDYKEYKSKTYFSWLSLSQQKIYVLYRDQ